VSIRYCVLGFVIAMAVACGAKKPTGPTPVPDPGPIVTNVSPVIGKFTVQTTRANAPANFANVLDDVQISVVVTDAEPSSTELKYNWSAAVGTFSGTGRSVIWKAPATVTSLNDVTINLEVVETYTSQGKPVENKVTGSTALSLHDSAKEVGDMAHQFLLDFSDSKITNIPFIMRNFEPGCYGTDAETRDVTANRENFEIMYAQVDEPTTKINFGGTCPFPGRLAPQGDACSLVRTYWSSIARRDFDSTKKGELSIASGIDHVAAFYYPAQGRWRLCDSQYELDRNSLRAAQIRGMVP
jgi:hypothetical protein